MIVFPAIDIQGGKVVRLRQGVKEDSTTYFDDPVETAVKWRDEGAMFLHVVDLDGAFSGDRRNAGVIGRICDAVDIPVQVGGGIRSEEAIETYLEEGVNRVIIGSKAVEDADFITDMARKYRSSLAVSIDAKGDMVATRGWVDGSDKEVLPFAHFLLSIGVNTIVYTDISRDGMLTGPNMEMLSLLQQLPFIRLIASGGVSGIDDLKQLQAMKVYGAITGKALYEGKVTMAQIRALGGM
ncbi:1-(5-phosphoribosyl)-5-[(5-phosphoribosylamino)methylideneamino]imidazole-4-carboxamide isomerase [uncultured Megasphaera sp.]|uniref:1-(5-phosphoribosyl)-5-[(5- phosphoribosylamino)methylideneamino]imidazole-4- carboxamide isomerase n=1 Tax=uncultured Megasphaera sp. TaxID=165188 RepID=UPI002634F53B|nr:1-(5-phosphoribosyl)-5-[(5-phosphoribosylamino)methylideneamino]imidazole-4-carboxamide isomerase [uncultured Megasphaera sp.]